MSTEPKYPKKMTRRIPDVPGGLETTYAPPGFFLVLREHATPDDTLSGAHPGLALRRLPEGQSNDDDDDDTPPAPGACPDCGQLQVSGTFRTLPAEDLPLKPYRTVIHSEGKCTILGDSDTIEMARASACGNPGAAILFRREPSEGEKLLDEIKAAIGQSRSADDWEARIQAELARAKRKFPNWPTDPVHAAAIVSEEAGELTRAVNEACYEPHKTDPARPLDAVITEAIQLGAMVRRFLESAGHYVVAPGPQHDQSN